MSLLPFAHTKQTTQTQPPPQLVERINATRANEAYLPGVAAPDGLAATADLGDALGRADFAFLVVPTPYIEKTLGARSVGMLGGGDFFFAGGGCAAAGCCVLLLCTNKLKTNIKSIKTPPPKNDNITTQRRTWTRLKTAASSCRAPRASSTAPWRRWSSCSCACCPHRCTRGSPF